MLVVRCLGLTQVLTKGNRMSVAGIRRMSAARSGLPAVLTVLLTTLFLAVGMSPQPASAAIAPVPLGGAGNFGVLAGTTVTNTGPTVVAADLGVSPGSAVTGFPPGTVVGTIHSADTTAAAAQVDLTTAYNDAAGRTPSATLQSALGGTTVTPGVYDSVTGSFSITGILTLDGEGDPNAVFIFQTASTLVTASGSSVNLINGATAANVFWQVGSSATLGTGSTLEGTILALTSITVTTGANVTGRALARNGAVTLDTSIISRAPVLSITAAETADLGTVAPGDTITGQLGPVRVDADGYPSWTASVSSTSFTSAGTPVVTIPNTAVSYWAGPVTAQEGTGTATSGQPTSSEAVTLDSSRTVFTMADGSDVNAVTWTPTLLVAVPMSAVADVYTATVTHSVA
jgi:ice-binding like protein